MVEWSLEDNIWVRRVAIDHQLLFKEKTDTDLLAAIIKNNLNDTEFFINKAIGWSLRDYSKTNPEWVTNVNFWTPLNYSHDTQFITKEQKNKIKRIMIAYILGDIPFYTFIVFNYLSSFYKFFNQLGTQLDYRTYYKR